MKTTPKLILAVTAVVSSCLISTSVWAGSEQRYRWEGVAIGVGAAIVGSTLINRSGYDCYGGPSLSYSIHYRQPYRSHHGVAKRHYGHRERKHHAFHKRSHGHYREHHYRDHRRHWQSYSHWRERLRHSYERGYRDGHRNHSRRTGPWR